MRIQSTRKASGTARTEDRLIVSRGRVGAELRRRDGPVADLGTVVMDRTDLSIDWTVGGLV